MTFFNISNIKSAPNFFNIPPEYHKFANIFSKSKADISTSHCSYNLNISLEEGIQPPVSTIYSFSASKQETLKKFIKKNLNIGFIQLISFFYSILVLFVKKKDKSLYLCINFCSLNYITKKNYYLLISDLQNSHCKAQVYTKIDHCYAYYLVCIANRDK